MIKHTCLAPFALAAAALIAFSGCSSDDPTPAPTAGAAGAPIGAGGASAGSGGASAGSAGAPAGGSTAGAGQAGAPSPPGDPVQGKSVYDMQCSSCHGTTGAGSQGPNITGSMTAGIGSWGEAVFTKSVREAVSKTGQPLCTLMAKFPATSISDAQMKNLYAYLMSIPNDTVNSGSQCP